MHNGKVKKSPKKNKFTIQIFKKKQKKTTKLSKLHQLGIKPHPRCTTLFIHCTNASAFLEVSFSDLVFCAIRGLSCHGPLLLNWQQITYMPLGSSICCCWQIISIMNSFFFHNAVLLFSASIVF